MGKLLYNVIESDDSFKFVGFVQEQLEDGWKLVGGINVALNSEGYPVYSQAVYRSVYRSNFLGSLAHCLRILRDL